MNSNQQKIKSLLTNIIDNKDYIFTPSTKKNIATFKNRALQNNVDEKVINQLVDLYEIVDCFQFKIIIGFNCCNDKSIFKNWNDNELNLGTKDFNALRWKYNKFCLGDTVGNISISEDYEFDTLVELIECCIAEIKEIEDY
jgi:hypothetical protein